MVKKVDHIGIAVKSIESQIYYYKNILGLGEPKIEIVEDQNVKTAMFQAGEVRIELLEPISSDSPISKFLEKRGEGIHHIAYQTDNLQDHLNLMEENNIDLIDKTPRKGTEGRHIAFIHPKSTFGVLTELCRNISNQ